MALFKMGEFINMAVKDEETGLAFYRSMAETTGNSKLKESFSKIADQENVHAERYRKMQGDVGDNFPREEYPGQYDNFLNALLSTRAFPEPEAAAREAKNLKTDLEAIDLALTLEKDTLLLYYDMQSFIPETHKNIVDDIIEEEKGHIEELAKLREGCK